MTTEAKPRLSLKEKAELLRENGVNVHQYIEAGESRFHPVFPIMAFHGDENEGQKAVDILQRHGIPVVTLRREWYYGRRDKYDEVCWVLIA